MTMCLSSEEDAARTYDKVVRRHRGARAVTNFGAAAEPAADPALAQAPTHSPSPLNASAARAALQALPSTCTPSCQSVSSLLPGEAPSSACQGPACRPEAHTEDEVHVLLPCQPLHPAWLDTPSPPGGQVCLQPAEYPSPVAGPCSQCDPPPNLDLVPPSWGRINPELLPSPGDACIAPALVCCTEPSSPGALMPPTPLTLLLHDHQELQVQGPAVLYYLCTALINLQHLNEGQRVLGHACFAMVLFVLAYVELTTYAICMSRLHTYIQRVML